MDNQRPVAFDTLLRHARTASGLTQEALAERAGLSARVISDIERGVICAPQRGTLEMLCRALGLTPEERTIWEATRQRASRRTSSRPASRGTSDVASFSNLPHPPTTLVGREQEVSEVVALLRRPATRFLTLTGPGGVGKTRLALAATQAAQAHYPDGAVFVDLAPVTDPALVVPAIADSLGVCESAEQSVTDELTSFLWAKQLLLVLDNAERVVDSAGQITTLLQACPSLTILATSRVPFQVQTEHLYPVPPLETTSAETATSETVLGSHAGRLFVERTRTVKPDFQLTDANAPAVASICSRLDGLPLAIELAASRMTVLPATAILARIDDRFNLLSDGPRDLPERQRALLSTIDWSYSLLNDEERRLFLQCAVFAGGWQIDAIEEFDAERGELGASPIGTLLSLVKQSLVTQREQPDGDVRFDMLESIREFGHRIADESGIAPELRAKHADWVARLVKQHAPLRCGVDLVPSLNRIDAEHANIRSALDWCIATGDSITGWRIAADLWLYWWMRNHLREGRRQFARLLELPIEHVPPRILAPGLTGAGIMAEWLNEPDDAIRLQQAAIEQWSRLPFSDRIDEHWSHVCLFNLAMRRGDLVEARQRAHIADELAQEHNDPMLQSMSAIIMGNLALQSGDVEQATTYYRRSLEHARRSSNPWAISLSLGNLVNVRLLADDNTDLTPLLDEVITLSRELGHAYQILMGVRLRGEYAIRSNRPFVALADIEEALERARWFGNAYEEASSLYLLGDVLARLGRTTESLKPYVASLHLAHAHDHPDIVGLTLDGLAQQRYESQQPEVATIFAAASHALRDRHGSIQSASERERSECLVAALRSTLSDEAFASAWSAGESMSQDDIVALAGPATVASQ